MKQYGQLQKWLQEHSQQYPKQRGSTSLEKQLGQWLHNQRKAQVNLDKRQGLTPERRRLLSELPNFSWSNGKPWTDGCVHVSDFSDQANRLPRRQSDNPEERRLAVWLKNQTQAARGKRYAQDVPEQHLKMLRWLPEWSLETRAEKDWNVMFQDLLAWPALAEQRQSKILPHCGIPNDARGRALGEWFRKQVVSFCSRGAPRRRLRKKTKTPVQLTPERAQRFEQFLRSALAKGMRLPSNALEERVRGVLHL